MDEVTLTNMVRIQDKQSGKILVQERRRSYPGIAFPGGHVEKGESIYDSAVREIKEETGYDIKNLKPCGFIYWDNENGDKYFTFFYQTTDYSGECIGETEEGKVFWIEERELENLPLAPNMEKYRRMFAKPELSECYCRNHDGDWETLYR